VAATQTIAASAQATAGGSLGAIATLGAASGGVFGSSANLLAAVSAQQAEASATAALSYVGRAAKNLV
jgi:hypothetical protein